MRMSIAKTFLAIGIAVVLAVFVGYALDVLYKSPETDYYSSPTCYSQYRCSDLTSKCSQLSGENYSKCYKEVTNSNEYNQCQDNYEKCNEDAQKPIYDYYRNKMLILTFIGIASIVTGIFIGATIGGGILAGGILIILYSIGTSYFYWRGFNEYLKLGILFIVLVLLIFLGYKKFGKKD